MQSKILITLETSVKEKKSTRGDTKAALDGMLEQLMDYINNNLTSKSFFDTVNIVNIQIQGENNDNGSQLKLDF